MTEHVMALMGLAMGLSGMIAWFWALGRSPRRKLSFLWEDYGHDGKFPTRR